MIARKFAILFVTLALILSACAPASQNQPVYEESAPGQPEAPREAPAAGGVDSDYAGNVPEARRLVITNATISVSVSDPGASSERIAQMAADMGGFVVTSRLYKTNLDNGEEVTQASITVRVPAERLNEALDKIRTESQEEPISQNTDSEDITQAYTDLEARLRNLEAAEKQLMQIMESTTNPDNVLSVYRELTGVREQIEVLKGQIKYYDEAVALSSIAVELYSEEAMKPLTIGRWEPVGVARDALQALIGVSKFLASAGIYIVLLVIPVLIMILLPVWAVIAILRRIRRGRTKAQPPAAPAAQ